MADRFKADPAVSMLGLLLLVPLALWAGFVFSKLWLWFLVPLGVHPIGAWTGTGLYLMGRYVSSSKGRVMDEEDFIDRAFVHPIFIPALALGLGALYNAFQR